MNKSILDRAQRLFAEGRAIVESEVELKKKSTQYIVRLANILKELYQIFLDRKDPTERLVLVSRTQGFAEFRDAMLELLRPLDLGERSGWYYLSIGRHLLGKIPEEALKDLPLEKVKQLARVAKVKHEISPQLVERAETKSLAGRWEEAHRCHRRKDRTTPAFSDRCWLVGARV